MQRLQRSVLAHYDPYKPLVISCDASPYGVGEVLAQEKRWEREASIAFASQTLETAEQNSAQTNHEGLPVVFATQHFHKFIPGRKVSFYNDYHPVLGIRGSNNPVS